MIIGAIAAVVANAAVSANAPSYLAGLLGAKWLFLIIIILGVGSGNFGNLYGPFLTFFAIISPSGKLASQTTGRTARLMPPPSSRPSAPSSPSRRAATSSPT